MEVLKATFFLLLCISYALCYEPESLDEKCRQRGSIEACPNHPRTCKKLACRDEAFTLCNEYLDTPDLEGLICGVGKKCSEGECVLATSVEKKVKTPKKEVQTLKKKVLPNSCSSSECYYTQLEKCYSHNLRVCSPGKYCINGQCLPGDKKTHKYDSHLDRKCRRQRANFACFKDERDCSPKYCFSTERGVCSKNPEYKPGTRRCAAGEYCSNNRCFVKNMIGESEEEEDSEVQDSGKKKTFNKKKFNFPDDTDSDDQNLPSGKDVSDHDIKDLGKKKKSAKENLNVPVCKFHHDQDSFGNQERIDDRDDEDSSENDDEDNSENDDEDDSENDDEDDSENDDEDDSDEEDLENSMDEDQED